MKRILILTSALACLLAAYLSGQSGAQQTAAVLTLASTKVGVVNMGFVFAHYDRVKAFKLEMDRDAQPYKIKKAELDSITREWKALAASADADVSQQTKDMAGAILIETARQLEDLERQFKSEIGKIIEDNMIVLNQEINEIVRAHAAAHGYHVLLAFGEPEVPLAPLLQFQRFMKVIDQGGMTHVYSSRDIDVSAAVVRTLNRKFQRSRDGDE